MKRLDEAGELDCHLKPIAKDSDSDSDVEEEEEEVVDFSRPGEGFRDEVEKTNRLYPNKVFINSYFYWRLGKGLIYCMSNASLYKGLST